MFSIIDVNFGIPEITINAMAKPSSSATDLPIVQPVKVLLDIGAQIRAARRRQALRIDDAASLCGVSVDLLSILLRID